jgi:P27 family predicted phage terminase small subunit
VSSRATRAPARLGPAGRAVWRRVASEYAIEDFNAREQTVLEQACRTLDLVAELAAQVDAEGLITEGSKGQRRAHPALSELRMQRKLAVDLLKQLGLDDAEAHGSQAAATVTVASARGSKAARARWAS